MILDGAPPALPRAINGRCLVVGGEHVKEAAQSELHVIGLDPCRYDGTFDAIFDAMFDEHPMDRSMEHSVQHLMVHSMEHSMEHSL